MPEMKSKRIIRTISALFLIILTSLNYNYIELKRAIKNFQRSKGIDEIRLYEKRFHELKEILPARGIVGYVTDKAGDPADKVKAFFLTRYTLAPLVVIRNKKHQLIVGNFSDPIFNKEIYDKDGFITIKNFGNGVVLFRREVNE